MLGAGGIVLDPVTRAMTQAWSVLDGNADEAATTRTELRGKTEFCIRVSSTVQQLRLTLALYLVV